MRNVFTFCDISRLINHYRGLSILMYLFDQIFLGSRYNLWWSIHQKSRKNEFTKKHSHIFKSNKGKIYFVLNLWESQINASRKKSIPFRHFFEEYFPDVSKFIYIQKCNPLNFTNWIGIIFFLNPRKG